MPTGGIRIFDVDRAFASQFTTSLNAEYPVWSPDSRRVVFAAGGLGQRDLYQKETTGVAGESRFFVEADGADKKPLAWSSDGQFLLYAARAAGGSELRVVRPAGTENWSPLVHIPSSLQRTAAEFSPDGRWVVFESSESGRSEVYVSLLPDATARFQVSTSGGRQPKWRAGGRELFFIQSDDPDTTNQWNGTVMVAEVRAEQTSFEIVGIRSLFRLENARPGRFDVTSDGRVVALVAAEDAAVAPITLVTNWPVLLNN